MIKLKQTAIFLAGVFCILTGFFIYMLEDVPNGNTQSTNIFGNVLYYTPDVIKIAVIGFMFGLGIIILSRFGKHQNNS